MARGFETPYDEARTQHESKSVILLARQPRLPNSASVTDGAMVAAPPRASWTTRTRSQSQSRREPAAEADTFAAERPPRAAEPLPVAVAVPVAVIVVPAHAIATPAPPVVSAPAAAAAARPVLPGADSGSGSAPAPAAAARPIRIPSSRRVGLRSRSPSRSRVSSPTLLDQALSGDLPEGDLPAVR